MPVNATDVSIQYQDAIDQLREVLDSPELSEMQRNETELAIQDLFLHLGTHAIQTVEGRTALLAALIAELSSICDGMVENPIGHIVDDVAALLLNVRELYDETKQDLTGA